MKKILSVKLEIIVLILICFIAFSLRAYSTYRDLIFAYDQGRDAWQMQKIASGHLTLIGPVTGLDGVYLGPLWYYLIFPAYMIGNGNPVFAAMEMKFFAVGVVILLYLWGGKMKLGWAGLLAGVLFTFSFSNILFARWLANPVPLPFFALLSFYVLWNAIERKTAWLYILTGTLLGCCLQLEAANSVWFLPTTVLIVGYELIIVPWRGKTHFFKNDVKDVLTAFFSLFIGGALTVLPQLLFELKYHFLLTNNLITAFHTTHEVSVLGNLLPRVWLLLILYGRGLFVDHTWIFMYLTLVLIAGVVLFRTSLFSKRGWRIAFFWFAVPFFFHCIYTGNHGNFWDYYVIAQHIALYLLLTLTLGVIMRDTKWRSVIIGFCGIFILLSIGLNLRKWTEIVKPYADRFSLQEQVDATNWMIDESQGRSYGAWVYTPSGQDDSFRYVFKWIGAKRGIEPKEHVEQQPFIYLVVENDIVYWKRHRDWIGERMSFGSLLAKHKFGAITVYKLQNTFLKSKIVQ